MKRVVVDTNIFISALFWKGTPGKAVETFGAKRAILLLSLDIVGELENKLNSAKFAARILAIGRTPAQIVGDFRRLAEMVTPVLAPEGIVRDRKDRMILAAALGGHADYVVSGDKDLTDLRQYEGVHILTPAQYLETLAALQSSE